MMCWATVEGPLGAVARAARSTTDALEGVSQRRTGTCVASSGGGGLRDQWKLPSAVRGRGANGRGLDGGWLACDVLGELLGMRKRRLCHGPRLGVALVRVAVADVSGRAARRLVVLAALACLACRGVALAAMGRGGERMGAAQVQEAMASPILPPQTNSPLKANAAKHSMFLVLSLIPFPTFFPPLPPVCALTPRPVLPRPVLPRPSPGVP